MEKTKQALPASVPVKLIEQLVDDIHKATGVRVNFTDNAGEMLARSEYQPVFCKTSAESPEFEDRCRGCSKKARECAAKTDGVYFYRCWRGLMNACISIRANEEIIGTLQIAGYVSTPEHMNAVEQILPDPDYQITPAELDSIPFIYPRRVQDTISIISIAANYLSEAYQRQEAERQQAQAEFKALQSQISPHFLFNALNSISQMALLEGAEQTPEAIYSLAALLRRSMHQNAGLIPLEEELQFVHDYVSFKQMLGRCPITYEEHIDPNVGHLSIPAISIQPLVENAIYHGLEPKPEGGKVVLTVAMDEDYLSISVEDDGIGFDPARGANNDKGEASGIGFSNVLNRLRLFYADKFKYEVDSVIGRGTVMTLYIPL